MELLFNHQFLSIIIFIAAVGIIIKAHKLYSKAPMKNLVFIAAGLTFGIIFEIPHVAYGIIYKYIAPNNYYLNLEFIYIIISRLIISISFIISSFFCFICSQEDKKKFVIKTYLIYGAISLLLILFIELGAHIHPTIANLLSGKIIVQHPSIEIINNALFLLSALIYTDIRRSNNKKTFSLFTLGLAILGAGQVYLISGDYLESFHRIYIHFSRIIAYILILLSLADSTVKSEYFSLRQKIMIYPSILIILIYLSFSIFSELIYGTTAGKIFQYKFLIFYITSIIISYIISEKLVNPIDVLITQVKALSSKKEPKPINIITNDEIAILTEKINTLAINNWELYKKEKSTVEREALLRKIIQRLRSTLDIEKTLSFICNEVAKVFNVQRSAITVFPVAGDYTNYTVRKEYKSSTEIKGFGYTGDFPLTAAYWGYKLIEKGEALAIDNIYEAEVPAYFKNTYDDMGIKSVIGTAIKKGKDIWGTLVLAEYNEFRHWTKSEQALLQTLADQVYIALYQVELYEKEKRTAEREALLRKIIERLRSFLDSKEMKIYITKTVASYFDADRCFIHEYDNQKSKFSPIDTECLSSPDIKSVLHADVSVLAKEFAFSVSQGKNNIIRDSEKFIKENKDKMPFSTKFLIDYEIKSDYGIGVHYQDTYIGGLIIHFVKKKKELTSDELNLLVSIANSAGIAIHQTRLYEKEKQLAERESILKEYVSRINLAHSIEDAYEFMLKKLLNIFKLKETFIVELSDIYPQTPIIKYNLSKNDSKLNTLTSKEIKIMEKFTTDIMNNQKSLEITNVPKYFTKDKNLENYLSNELKIKSILIIPLIKYEKKPVLLGKLILCSDKIKNWEKEELDLLNEMLFSSSVTIWEIKKENELNELRDTFILTLAHDLQVPLIGERRALEFILSIPPGKLLDDYKEIIEETVKSNIDIFNFLTILVDSYNYELGRKKLGHIETDIQALIEEVIDELKSLAKSKSININLEINKKIPIIITDKDEIKKVTNTLLKNALTYTQKKGEVTITGKQTNGYIEICVSDNGPGIQTDIKQRLFKRYEMALALDRKIGSGLSLYIAKQIIEAHNGKLWFESKEGKGTKFYFTLPINTTTKH